MALAPSGQMADDPELLKRLLEKNLERRREALQNGDTAEAMRIMEESEQLHRRLMAIADPAMRGGEGYDPEPKPTEDVQSTTAAPDLAVEGERTGLAPDDPRVRRAEQRDVSRQLGQGDAEQIMAKSEAARQQQLRSPTAAHGGSANMNAKFGPGSPLGATPDDLPWDRPTQTDPDADPVGIVPGDRPIRMPGRLERRDPGQGIWTGDISRPDMDKRVQEAMDGRGYYADKIKTGMSEAEVRAVIERGDIAQRQRTRGSRASLKEDHALAARARAQGLGLEPPELYETTQEGGGKVTRGSRAHLTQARRQEQQQRAFLRANQGRGGLRGSLTGDEGGDSGFDPVLYQNLLRQDPRAAATYRSTTARNRQLAKQAGIDSRRADAAQRTSNRQVDIAQQRLNLEQRDAQKTETELQEQKNDPAVVATKTTGRFDAYKSTEQYPDRWQTSVEEDDTLAPNAGVSTVGPEQKEHWKRVAAMKNADTDTETGKWDKQAYLQLKHVFDTGSFKTRYQDNGAEQYADWIQKNREEYGLPGWMTRSHIIMAYGHFGTKSDVYKKELFKEQDTGIMPGTWFDRTSSPEDWDFHFK
ncbi:MAG: hypothetical protein Unbinned1606contig1000_58 [Prokaryotic dsDNA virus sp.]|nr:MAG: hypothetical protein Unbinned1606contig1000_58 [Prokaryotic dsDNA virus sp.]